MTPETEKTRINGFADKKGFGVFNEAFFLYWAARIGV